MRPTNAPARERGGTYYRNVLGRTGSLHGSVTLGIAIPLLLVASERPSASVPFGCGGRSTFVGYARPIDSHVRSAPRDEVRMDRLTETARQVGFEPTLEGAARKLRAAAESELGPLSGFDRFWLGTAWWAFHQPATHTNYPSWAPDVRHDPNLALRHPEGGNCESSANAHAALLSFLEVPSKAVYGHYGPKREGHVWTISDVDGLPLSADVHLARATLAERRGEATWRPSTLQIQVDSNLEGARTFLRKHRPEDVRMTGLAG